MGRNYFIETFLLPVCAGLFPAGDRQDSDGAAAASGGVFGNPLFAAILALVLFIPPSVHALDVPRFQGYVNDYAELLSSGTKARLQEKLKALEESGSTQIFVLTVPSLEGDAIEDFAIRVFDSWKAGQKGKDNGVILIVSRQERRIRIEVGRGLEGKLTDLAAGRIIDTVIKPKVRTGDFEGGLSEGVSAIVEMVKGEFQGTGTKKVNTTIIQKEGFCFFLAGTLLVFAVIWLRARRRCREDAGDFREGMRTNIKSRSDFGRDWLQDLGIGFIAIPVIAFATVKTHNGDGHFERVSVLCLFFYAIMGLVVGVFAKALGEGALGGRGGGFGSGAGGGGDSAGGDSDGGGDAGGCGGGGGDSGGGGSSD